MRGMGVLGLGVAAAAGIVAIVIGVQSIPDIKRYIHIRRM